MATIQKDNLGVQHEKLTITLDKQDYLPAVDKTIKSYARTANIPGFRKGMVPAGLVRKMYGQSVLADEVVKMASNKLEEYLKNENLSIFGQPMLYDGVRMNFDINNLEDYVFVFEIGIKPVFEIPAIVEKAPVTRYKIIVADKMIDDEIERIRNQYGTEETVETPADEKVIVYLDISGCDEAGNVINAEEKKSHKGELGKLPVKVRELLNGKLAGESIIVKPSEVCTAEELAEFLKYTVRDEQGADNFYLFTIDKYVIIIPAELNAELYLKVYPNKIIDNEDAFRASIAGEISNEYDRITYEKMQNDIFEMLVHTTPIQLPVDFLKKYLREGEEKHRTAEEVEKEFPGFEHSLRWQLITEKITRDFNIVITKDEVLDHMMLSVLNYFGIQNADDAPWLESYRAKLAKDEKMMEENYNKILVKRMFEVIESQLTIAETDIEEGDFYTIAAQGSHHHH